MRIRELRLARKLSMREVARGIGVALTTYREWENGRSPRGDHLIKLARYFGVSSEALAGQRELIEMTFEERLHRIKDDVAFLIEQLRSQEKS